MECQCSVFLYVSQLPQILQTFTFQSSEIRSSFKMLFIYWCAYVQAHLYKHIITQVEVWGQVSGACSPPPTCGIQDHTQVVRPAYMYLYGLSYLAGPLKKLVLFIPAFSFSLPNPDSICFHVCFLIGSHHTALAGLNPRRATSF